MIWFFGFFGTVSRPIAFRQLKGTIFLTSNSSLGLQKKRICIKVEEKFMIIMFKIFSNISPATFLAECFLKVLTFPSGLVAGWLLRIILDGTVLGDSFKEINLFIPLYVLFKSLS